jgi:hypothetical protein
VDNPAWGNNAEASSSRGIRMPRLTLISSPHSVSPPQSVEHPGAHQYPGASQSNKPRSGSF